MAEARSVRFAARTALRCAALALVIGSASGCAWDISTVSGGAIGAANTSYGRGEGATFGVGLIEWECCQQSRGYGFEFDRIEYETGGLSRLTCLYGSWLGEQFFFSWIVVGGGMHWDDTDGWGLGPAAEVSFGVVVPFPRNAVVTVELFVKGYAWLGSRDGSFDAGLDRTAGARLTVVIEHLR